MIGREEAAEARQRIEHRLFMDQQKAMQTLQTAAAQTNITAQMELHRLIAGQQRFNQEFAVMNFFMPDRRPLDERFLDFKRRLDDAVRRNERRKGNF